MEARAVWHIYSFIIYRNIHISVRTVNEEVGHEFAKEQSGRADWRVLRQNKKGEVM